LKTNFRKNEDSPLEITDSLETDSEKKDLTKEEFEEYITKSGAKGSFMVYRSSNPDEELGLDEL